MSNNSAVPKLSGITISVDEGESSKKVTVKTTAKQNGKLTKVELYEMLDEEPEKPQNIVSFIKSKVAMKVNKIKEKLEQGFSISKNKAQAAEKNDDNEIMPDKSTNVLEND